MKRFCFTLILVLIIFSILFAIGEVCFRVFRDDTPPLASITQKRKDVLIQPNLLMHNKSSVAGEYEYTTRINSLGYRGKEFSVQKDPKTVRILAVGDSFTFGILDDEHTIPYLLEQDLKAKGLNVEIINAGIGHASPIDHYLNLKNIHLKYQPDVVLLFFDLTDLWDDWHKERHAVYGKDGEIDHFDPTIFDGKRDWWVTATLHSAFCRYIHNKIVRTFQKIQVLGWKNYFNAVREGKRAKALIANAESVANKDKIEYDGLVMMRGSEKKDLILEHWPRTAGYLEKIKNLLAAKHIPLVIIMYPHGIYVGKDQWAHGRLTWGFEADKIYTDRYPFDLVGDFAKKEGLPFINTLDDFLSAPPKSYFYDWDGHLNADGNKIVADALAKNPELEKLLNSIPHE